MQRISIQLAPETADDWWEVEALYDLCFAPGRTALSSYRLREDVEPIGPLCWIARDPDAVLAGVVRCWPVIIGDELSILLGPIAVHPTRQGEGIAALLVYRVIEAASDAGWSRILLVGDLPFYRRFGFDRLDHVVMPPPTNPDRVLGLALTDKAWDGVEGNVSKSNNCIWDGSSHLKDMKDPDIATIKPNFPGASTGLSDAARNQIAQIAHKQRKANGVLMQAINFVGGQVEDGLKLLPQKVRLQLDDVARKALRHSYDIASKSRDGVGGRIGSDRAHKVIGTVSGAVGGFGGLPTAIAELPVATTLIFRAVQSVAAEHGEDPLSEETRMECLAVFGAGGPGAQDDGVDTSFIGARLSLSGAAVNGLIRKVAPKFAAVLSQKLASQAVPVLGAAAGAGTNYAFLDYYVSIAHVHFGLRNLARSHGEAAVTEEFHRVLAAANLPQT